MKKTILRKCLATNQMYPKDTLLRVCKNKAGEIFYDPTDKAPGRGAYILKSKDAIALAKRKHVLDKAFQVKVDESIYDELLKEIN
ncbi:MAG: YlxR family protein [Bacilli bacterium]|nr:YlxR family protein [Bacilli bacterium]